MSILKAKFVQEITVKDPDTGNLIEMEVYKHENGGMFAIDSSFVDQCTESDEPHVPDMFNPRRKVKLVGGA